MQFALFSFFLLAEIAHAQPFTLEQLQGAWWSQEPSPTAAFAIQGQEVWLDYDSTWHPATIEGDILIFDLGPESGIVRNRIISLGNRQLTLQTLCETCQNPALQIFTQHEPSP